MPRMRGGESSSSQVLHRVRGPTATGTTALSGRTQPILAVTHVCASPSRVYGTPLDLVLFNSYEGRPVGGDARGLAGPGRDEPWYFHWCREAVSFVVESLPVQGGLGAAARSQLELRGAGSSKRKSGVAMFERFTHRARRVIILAQKEAIRLNHRAVGTEHILLGIIREGEGVASKILESLNISPERVQADIEQAVGRGEHAHQEVAFTPSAKKVLELALEEARQLGHNYTGTEHLLLGLIREGESVAARVLEATGVAIHRARVQVVYLLGEEIRAPADADLADGIEKLTQAVVSSAQLSHDLKNAVLEHLSYLSDQAALSPANRRPSVIKTVSEALERLLANTTGLNSLWEALKSRLVN